MLIWFLILKLNSFIKIYPLFIFNKITFIIYIGKEIFNFMLTRIYIVKFSFIFEQNIDETHDIDPFDCYWFGESWLIVRWKYCHRCLYTKILLWRSQVYYWWEIVDLPCAYICEYWVDGRCQNSPYLLLCF